MEPGEDWGYREKQGTPLTPVVVLQIGTRRPARVRVRFLDDSFEGREEWVPPARLKVRWDDAERWMERERRRDAVHESSPHYDDPELYACGLVFDAVAATPADSLYNDVDDGVLVVRDLDSLTALCGITEEALMSDPVAFKEGDSTFVVPWTTTREVAQRLAHRHPDQVVDLVARTEADDRRYAIYGQQWGRGEDRYSSPEICAETAAMRKPSYDLVRKWCGSEAVDRHEELVALREEVRRLGILIERAVASLASTGRKKEAAAIERELGVPVETVRRAAEAHQDLRRR